MKYKQRFFLFALLNLLPFSAWACSCAPSTPPENYSYAYVVALVRADGSGPDDKVFRGLEVVRSWKRKLPERIEVTSMGEFVMCGYYIGKGVHLLYLSRSIDGRLKTHDCAGNQRETSKYFREHIDWLEKFGAQPE
jgi:hypothetical protein